MECSECGNPGGNKNPIFTCDSCKGGYCKPCANLTSSEVRVLDLREGRVLKFFCKKCEKFEHHSLLLQTIGDKTNIIEAKEEIIALLKKKINDLENFQTENNGQQYTYSQITQKGQRITQKKINLPSIVIKPKRQQNIEKTETDVKNSIKLTELKIAINNTRNTKNGGILINCTNKNDIEMLRKEAENKLKEYDVQITKLKLPRFKIIGYEGELDEQQISRAIRKQNNLVEDEDIFRVTYIKKAKRPNTKAVVFGECSASLFRKLMCTNRIHIEWQRYPIYEDLSIVRCFKCQQHYHKTDACPNAQSCEHCSEEHHIKECPNQQKKCVNCLQTNKKFKSNYDVNHKASDTDCPSYQYLLNIVRSKIDYDSGNGF